MPIKDYTPEAELMVESQVAQFVGTGDVLFTVSDDGDPPTDTTVEAPDTWAVQPANIYQLLSAGSTFRIGLGASDRLDFAMGSTGGLLGTWSFRINPTTDLIEVRSTGEAFTIAVDAPNAWGMTGAIASALVGGVHVATAQVAWDRDNVAAADLVFEVTGVTSENTGTFSMPAGVYQGIPEILLDFDDVSDTESAAYDPLNRAVDNLSVLLQDAMEDPSGGWWYRTDAGYAAVVIRADYELDIDTEFCRWLGFLGTESFVEIDTEDEVAYKQAIATGSPVPNVLTLNRCLDYVEPTYSAEVSGAESADGGIEKSHINTLQGWNISFTLEGVARGELENVLQAMEEFLPYLFSTNIITVYQNRRERRLSGLRLLATGHKKHFDRNYSAYSTPETNGYVGCLRCALPLGQNQVQLNLTDIRVRALYVPIQLSLMPYVHRQGAA